MTHVTALAVYAILLRNALDLIGPWTDALVLPVSFPKEWKQISVHETICPVFGKSPPKGAKKSSSRFYFWDPMIIKGHKSKGWTCHKRELTTKCFENFFGSKSVTHSSRAKTITPAECSAALDKYHSASGNPLVEHPPRSCSWMKTRYNHAEFVTVLPLEVPYDFLTRGFVDAIFPGGKCSKSPCKTVTDSTIWQHDNAHPDCPKPHSFLRNYWYKDGTNQPYVGVQDRQGEYRDIEHACSQKFCGRKVLRFKNGEFVGSTWTRASRPCLENEHLRYATSNEESERTSSMVLERVAKTLCMREREEAASTGKITPLFLSSLSSPGGGSHPVYKYEDGILSTGDAEHITMKVLPVRPRLDDPDWKSSYWSPLLRDGGCKTGIYINGIHFTNSCRLIVPHGELRTAREDLSLMESLELQEISHPVVRIVSNHTSLSGTEDHTDDDGEVSFGSFNLPDFSPIQMTGFISGILGCIFFLICCSCVCCNKRCWPQPKNPGSPDKGKYMPPNRSPL